REASSTGDALDETDRLAGLRGRPARRRLVEQEQLGLADQRDAQLELLLVTVREEAADLAGLVLQPDGLEHRVRLVAVEALDPGEEAQAAAPVRDERGLHVLEHGQPWAGGGSVE